MSTPLPLNALSPSLQLSCNHHQVMFMCIQPVHPGNLEHFEFKYPVR